MTENYPCLEKHIEVWCHRHIATKDNQPVMEDGVHLIGIMAHAIIDCEPYGYFFTPKQYHGCPLKTLINSVFRRVFQEKYDAYNIALTIKYEIEGSNEGQYSMVKAALHNMKPTRRSDG